MYTSRNAARSLRVIWRASTQVTLLMVTILTHS